MAIYHGSQGELRIGGTIASYVTSVSFEVASNREPVFELGDRKFIEMKDGNLEITGTVEEMYQDNEWLTDVSTATPTEYSMKCIVKDENDNGYQAQLSGVVFTDDSYELAEDDLTSESLDFQARDITLSPYTP